MIAIVMPAAHTLDPGPDHDMSAAQDESSVQPAGRAHPTVVGLGARHGSSEMISPPQVFILSTNPVFATSLQYWLRSGPHPFHSRWLGSVEPALAAAPAAGAILLLAPQHWRELACWLPHVRRSFSSCRWLVFGDLRLGGMFGSLIDEPCCTLVAPYEAPDRLRVSLWVLTEGHALNPPGMLKAFVARSAADCPQAVAVAPSTRELECACGVSLGLDNRQIGQLLYMAEGTVKGHVARLCRKLDVATREDLAAYMERVLAPSCPSLG
jgi:DNA-binding CsgD family transcriptional regulator